MNILVVDPEAEVRLLFFSASDQLGCEVYFAETGAEALTVLNDSHSIGIAVIATNLPDMPSIELSKRIRRSKISRHTPILFLSDTRDSDRLVDLLEYGDDVVVKPFSQPILLAKLLAHRRTRELYKQIEIHNAQLEGFQARVEAEHQIATDVFSRITAKNLPNTRGITSFVSPYSSFNGDLLLMAPRPGEGFNVLVADITGHGLPAALGTMPIAEIFFAMTQRGFSVGDIAHEMNSVFRARMPDYLLCAAVLMSVLDNGERVQIWSGGMPPLVVFDTSKRVESLSPPIHMALGALPADEFDATIFTISLQHGQMILCYTDGVTETMSINGDLFGEERLLDTIARSGDNDLVQSITDALYAHAGGTGLSDDVTIFCFDRSTYLGVSDFSTSSAEQLYAQWDHFRWRSEFEFNAAQIRSEDPLDLMFSCFPAHPMVRAARADLSLILNELFVNAVDHGLLGLSSALKNGDDGLLIYFERRAQLLQELEQGSVHFEIGCRVENGVCEFDIACTDSGDGFDLQAILNTPTADERYSGRGLTVLAAMCSAITTNASGNSVQIRYRWPAIH